jgi:CYTH domain-containing protein
VGIEREIRYVVTEGTPPAGGEPLVQAFLLRRPVALRVRVLGGARAVVTLKAKRGAANLEWERPFPLALARAVLRGRFPRIEKTRLRDGDLEIDVFAWPGPLVVVECELPANAPIDLEDPAARAAWMASRRPAWVRAWHDVTGDRSLSNAALAKPRPTGRRRSTRR